MQRGTLYLIPVPLAENASLKSFTPFLVDTINAIGTYIVENEKTARKFLKEAGLKTPQSELVIYDYGKHKRGTPLVSFFKELMTGIDVGLMSEAGCPGVADPGSEIVSDAHKRGIKVVPLVGPNSMIQAIMASGFNGQSFVFNGYLPIDKAERAKKIKDMEMFSAKYRQTQLFMETPFRNNQLFEEVLRNCHNNTQLCVASNINAEEEFIKTKAIGMWRNEKIDLHKKPTVFLIYKNQ